MDVWMDGCMYGGMDDGWMDGRIDGWMNGRIDGWMDGIDSLIHWCDSTQTFFLSYRNEWVHCTLLQHNREGCLN